MLTATFFPSPPAAKYLEIISIAAHQPGWLNVQKCNCPCKERLFLALYALLIGSRAEKGSFAAEIGLGPGLLLKERGELIAYPVDTTRML